MLRLIGNVVFGVGYMVGWIKHRLGIIVVIPEKYRTRKSSWAAGFSKRQTWPKSLRSYTNRTRGIFSTDQCRCREFRELSLKCSIHWGWIYA